MFVKKSLLLFLSILSLSSCAQNLQKIVVKTHDNGTPQLVKFYTKKSANELQKQVLYYGNGQIKLQGHYKNGVKEGKWISYYENGKKWSSGKFQNGRQEGLYKSWHANGSKYIWGSYKNGEREGVWKFYDERNRLLKKINYSSL